MRLPERIIQQLTDEVAWYKRLYQSRTEAYNDLCHDLLRQHAEIRGLRERMTRLERVARIAARIVFLWENHPSADDLEIKAALRDMLSELGELRPVTASEKISLPA